jgi:hypothetical protein
LIQFKHRNGEKVTNGDEDHTSKQDEEEDATEQATEHVDEPAEEERSGSGNNKGGKTFNRFSAKFNKQNGSKEETDSEAEGKTELPVSRNKLFSTSERTPGIASHFVPKVKQVADVPSSTTTTSTTITSSTTTASVEETTRKKTFGFGKDLLSSIPVEDDISALLPEGFNLKPETSSIGFVQVIKKYVLLLYLKLFYFNTFSCGCELLPCKKSFTYCWFSRIDSLVFILSIHYRLPCNFTKTNQ